ncbi:hypothetical protein IVB41_32310 [Bradyrhizobium sp. 44]|uniref:hypothetical protein n=1 Tax=unclassified Bradyrhizobium TaxID=2631580 RepID=UPI001FFBECDF|nr:MULTISPECIES: hypothetical protein [unclassified Bradyrhizobium]MCK1288594.1 hypothetical protein [Bradyrhizobium sp. 44]UPJ43967.1 hypothetical protein IVB40_07825 [Bradyrhizobium sp. 40]
MLSLPVEALQVIELRLRLLAAGKGTPDEIFLVVNEKIDALAEARNILIRSGAPAEILDNHRKIIAASALRLSETGPNTQMMGLWRTNGTSKGVSFAPA